MYLDSLQFFKGINFLHAGENIHPENIYTSGS
jgi:hypothetical protein